MDPIQENISPQIPPVVPSSKKSNFVLPVVIGLLMLTIGLAGGYFLAGNKAKNTISTNQQQMAQLSVTPSIIPAVTTPASTGSSNFSIYRNDQFGVSFQYPSNWKT